METAQAMGWGPGLVWATEQEWALVLAWVLWGSALGLGRVLWGSALGLGRVLWGSALGLGRVWEPVTGWGWY